MNAKIQKPKIPDNVIDFNPDQNKKEYKLGDSGRVLRLDTADLNFPDRLNNALQNIEGRIKELSDKYGIHNIDDIGNISTGSIEGDIAILRETDSFIKEQLNSAFDYDISSVAFGKASCITVTEKGEYFFEAFLNAVYPVIEKEYNTRVKRLSKRVEKYTSKKGLHSK